MRPRSAKPITRGRPRTRLYGLLSAPFSRGIVHKRPLAEGGATSDEHSVEKRGHGELSNPNGRWGNLRRQLRTQPSTPTAEGRTYSLHSHV